MSQIEYYTAKKYCCITLENPNYNRDFVQNPWGYDTMELVNALAFRIMDIVGDKSIILVAQLSAFSNSDVVPFGVINDYHCNHTPQ